MFYKHSVYVAGEMYSAPSIVLQVCPLCVLCVLWSPAACTVGCIVAPKGKAGSFEGADLAGAVQAAEQVSGRRPGDGVPPILSPTDPARPPARAGVPTAASRCLTTSGRPTRG